MNIWQLDICSPDREGLGGYGGSCVDSSEFYRRKVDAKKAAVAHYAKSGGKGVVTWLHDKTSYLGYGIHYTLTPRTVK